MMSIKDYIELGKVKKQLDIAFDDNSEQELLKVLKNNSFLFFELIIRKAEETRIFHEVPFGNYRCDFLWYDRSSYGTHCVLVEVEKPRIDIMTKNNSRPTAEFNMDVSKIQKWKNYLDSISERERKDIFGNIIDFKYILVVGTTDDWEQENAMRWRIAYNTKNSPIVIRSSTVFLRAIEQRRTLPSVWFSCFEKYPQTQSPSMWQEYVKDADFLSVSL